MEFHSGLILLQPLLKKGKRSLNQKRRAKKVQEKVGGLETLTTFAAPNEKGVVLWMVVERRD